MNVLSLFDGISCGQLALRRAGICYDVYHASEIDEHAIQVTSSHFLNTNQLGDVTGILDCGSVDLLMGGSPCQGFSRCGRGLAFNDDRSKLFFEFMRLLDSCNPRYFLLENVKMKQEYQDIISGYLGVSPCEINSSCVSKQMRKRLYWTNIPFTLPEDVGDNFDGWLYQLGHGYLRDQIKFYVKYPTLVAQSPASKYRIIVDLDVAKKCSLKRLRRDSSVTRCATPEECEEFQTLPVGYTSCLKKTHRYRVIGNGWTVDVVSHILKGISNG